MLELNHNIGDNINIYGYNKLNFIMIAIRNMLIVLIIVLCFLIILLTEYLVVKQKDNFEFLSQLDFTGIKRKIPEQRVILAWTGFFGQNLWFWDRWNKGKQSINKSCGNYECIFTREKDRLNESDMVIFHLRNGFPDLPPRRKNQEWVMAIWESPLHTYMARSERLRNVFNRSITYRQDSDLHFGYGFMSKKTEKPQNFSVVPEIAKGKNKLVSWHVSNCGPRERKAYASELSKYVQIDTFGSCGKRDPCNYERNCVMKLKQKYKFCLAFENSRCRDYITEKYWFSAVSGCVPIVLGPSIENYNQKVPPNSFLHVDNFTSPEDLANYTKYLDQNDDAYYEYHMWRHKYNVMDWGVDHIWDEVFCKFCSVYDAKPHKTINLLEFWGTKANCK